jgi:molybdopterin converting factor small subunit
LSVAVKVPTQLRSLTAGEAEVEASGATLSELIEDLERRHPGIKHRLVGEDGGLRRFVNVYVDDEDVRFLEGLSTAIPERARVAIIPAVAGG